MELAQCSAKVVEADCFPAEGRKRAVLFDFGGVVCTFSHEARFAALARASGLRAAEVHRRLFDSGFDLECDRGDYSLEQQCKEICSRIHLTCTPIEIAGFWAQAFSPKSDVLAIVSQVRDTRSPRSSPTTGHSFG
jgi:glucose-1-phosphatase